ncbi:Hypothetical protein R9X50_00206200 [Acrodontium crateriforme]|uniref:AB hydrolase-1 domain-containing protein n=1 Tax=Acrodontium crateriforme TaxID=150365 RepID=A0AAQ3M695_9PEZI|nr:Hypothetical protein R9X50_00206200 [Acrodontium crateriforme]
MKKTLLLVFIHGFKGTDDTFENFPKDLRALLAHSLPKIDILSVQYPRYETRGNLQECVSRFKEWLQNKVIDLEVANQTPSPTVDPSVHVVLCGHSMGGIVAAETLLSIASDEPVPSSYANDTTNSTTGRDNSTDTHANLAPPEPDERSSSAPPLEPTRLFFPYIEAVLAFDTPYLGISPGVLAHGAEEHFNTASNAYKAYDTASQIFGWKSPGGASTPIANSSARGLPAANGSGWGKWAMVGGAAAAVAGAAGAAYLNWNQINQGLTWAGSHLEFVGCLARGAELQKRVEKVTELTKTHGVGFANFYGALDEKITSKTKYAGAMLGEDRTFCVIPRNTREPESPTGTKREAPSMGAEQGEAKRRKGSDEMSPKQKMKEGEQVRAFAKDPKKNKGKWVKCVNPAASDELKSHTSMFSSKKNPDYHAMLPRARDQILDWVNTAWYESSMDKSKSESSKEPQESNTMPAEEDQGVSSATDKTEL